MGVDWESRGAVAWVCAAKAGHRLGWVGGGPQRYATERRQSREQQEKMEEQQGVIRCLFTVDVQRAASTMAGDAVGRSRTEGPMGTRHKDWARLNAKSCAMLIAARTRRI